MSTSEKDIDFYHKYYQKERKRLGFDKYDEERTYIDSALSSRIDLHPEIDKEYLQKIMPKNKPVKENVLDVLESKCVELMKAKAASGKTECKFSIPEIIPGLSHIKPERVVQPLTERLIKRSGVKVEAFKTEQAYFLKINWD